MAAKIIKYPFRYYLWRMMTYGEAFQRLREDLLSLYDTREAAAIAHEVLYHITSLSKIDRMMLKDQLMDALQQNSFDYMSDELRQGKPLQYVTGLAWFMEQEFNVNEAVLIPRPETEELVYWIRNDHAGRQEPLTVLDIGTGSGCIAITVKQGLPLADVSACDISPAALAMAAQNAADKNAAVSFMELDLLDEAARNELPAYDIIVSNPPYIPQRESAAMHRNVAGFEPASALFVPDDDPLLFYRHIAVFGHSHLRPGGAVYCELHRDYSEETAALFRESGYTQVITRKDMHDNWRMLKAHL
jgi:release factor glutamine methyltransferase